MTNGDDGTFNFSGSGMRTVQGNFENNGLVKVTGSSGGTEVRFFGNYVENGCYFSDPATSHFTSQTIGTSGWLMGEPGTSFCTT